MSKLRWSKFVHAHLVAIHGNACGLCGREMTRATGDRQRPTDRTVDHIVPVSRGGNHKLNNLRYLCHKCNDAKGAMTDAEYLATLHPARA